MKRSFPRYTLLFLMILTAAVLLTTCRGPSDLPKAEVKTEAQPPILGPRENEALLSFLTGAVSVRRKTDWLDALIGEVLTEKQSLKTDGDSTAELQLGNMALIQVQENTEVSMETLLGRPGSADIDIRTASGSLLFQVQNLGAGDRFRIRTDLAVVGVRGTKFLVRSGGGSDTVIAVQEGEVSVFPSAVDMDSLREKLAGREQEFSGILDSLEASTRIVGAAQEVVVRQNRLDTVAAGISALESALDAALQAETVSPETLSSLKTRTEASLVDIDVMVGEVEDVSDMNREALELIDTMRWAELPAAGASAAADAGFVKIAAAAEPAGAAIFLDGRRLGDGNAGVLAREGETLAFRFSEPGYKEQALDISVKKGEDISYTVKLAPEIDPELLADIREEIRADLLDELRAAARAAPGLEPGIVPAESPAEIEARIRRSLEMELRRELTGQIRRELTAQLTPKPLSVQEKILGVWETLVDGTLGFMQFLQDGTFRTWNEAEADPITVGMYEVSEGRLTMMSPDGTQSGAATIEFPTDWKLILTIETEPPRSLYRSQ